MRMCFFIFSYVAIRDFPCLSQVCFICCHQVATLPLNCVATNGTHLFFGSSLKSRTSSTAAIQLRNSSGCRPPKNSGMSIFRTDSQRLDSLAFLCQDFRAKNRFSSSDSSREDGGGRLSLVNTASFFVNSSTCHRSWAFSSWR